VTTYRIIEFDDLTCGVEITYPGRVPYVLYGFPSELHAEVWIEVQELTERGGRLMASLIDFPN